ncbi:PP0621 family protein [Burkholderia alba]|uniref:PP0621 family protein n=1 Tax=Burkholderia alba TaxID=2683677 RepID=UPI002B051EA1|nr:PP0621 family protein [Burkholderia alba]
MRQILLLIFLFFASTWLARKIRRAQARAERGGGPFPGAGQPPAGAAGHGGALAEPMVRCAECGVHAPKGEAVAAGGQFYCSAEHAARHAARAGGRDAQ